jgi:hypothetical protein
MKCDRGWYLVALGVLAMGITNSSVGDSARGVLDRVAVAADHLSARAIQAVAVAQLMSDRGDAGWAHAQTALAKAQVRMAVAQAKMHARRATLTESRSNCVVGDLMNRAIVLSSQEDSDQDEDLQ